MASTRLRLGAVALAVFATASVVASTASAHNPPLFPGLEVPLANGEAYTIDTVAVANVSGNMALFEMGCYGHPAVGTYFGMQNATAAAVAKVAKAGQQPQPVFTIDPITLQPFPPVVPKSTLTPYTAAQLPNQVPYIDNPDGTYELAIAIDPKAFTNSPLTSLGIAVNPKLATGNPLPASPILSMDAGHVQLRKTADPNFAQVFNQPFKWDCNKLKVAEAAIPPLLTSLGLLGKGLKIPARGRPAMVKFQKARAGLQALLKKEDAEIKQDDYMPPLDAIPALLMGIKSVQTTGKALGNYLPLDGPRPKFLRQLKPVALQPFSTFYLGFQDAVVR